jgi:hypothetical protein
MRNPTASTFLTTKPRATGGFGVRYARRPRCTRGGRGRGVRYGRTIANQGASRKLSVHAVVLCASCPPLYCPGATRPRKACSRLTSRFRVASYCRRVDLVCVYARRPRRKLRSHVCRRAPRKLSAHAVALCSSCPPTILPRRYAPAASAQPPYLTLPGCALLSQSGPGVRLARHRRRQKALRRQRCTARRIAGCEKHCDDNDVQPDRFSHGRRSRDVRYARTIINAHHVN